MTRLAMLLLVLAGCQPWTRVDTAMQVAVSASLYADYMQTSRALATDGVEGNPIIGPRGERVPPPVYFTACMAGSAAVAGSLPRPWRSLFQAGVIALQARTIAGNWAAGYAVDF